MWVQFQGGQIGDAFTGIFTKDYRTDLQLLLTPGDLDRQLKVPDRATQAFHHGPKKGVNVLMRKRVVQGSVNRAEKEDFHPCIGQALGTGQGGWGIGYDRCREIVATGGSGKGLEARSAAQGTLDQSFEAFHGQNGVFPKEAQDFTPQVARFDHGPAHAGGVKEGAFQAAALIRAGAADEIKRAADA